MNERLQFAIKLLEKHDIEYSVKNVPNGQIHCRRKSDDKLFSYYANTGTIAGISDKKGIHQLINIVNDL